MPENASGGRISTRIPESMLLKFLFRREGERRRGIGRYERIKKHEGEEEEICSEAEVTVTRRKARRLFKLGRSRPGPRTSKQDSSEIQLSRSGHGIRRDERIRKEEEEEEEISSEKEGITSEEQKEKSSEAEDISSGEQKEKCSEAEVTVPRKKRRRLFKLGQRSSGPKRRSKRRRMISRSISEMRHHLSEATRLSQLKVSWRRFTKVLKNNGLRWLDLLTESKILQHMTPYPGISNHALSTLKC